MKSIKNHLQRFADSPRCEQIKAARLLADLSTAEAAEIACTELRTWQHYEKGTSRMTRAAFNKFLEKTRGLYK